MKRALTGLVMVFLWSGSSFAVELPQWHGFVEQAFGGRLSRDKLTKHRNYNMLEQRLQLKTSYPLPGENIFSRWNSLVNIKADFLVDEYFNTSAYTELREANLAFTPARMLDIKIGRQVLTWGTGDYLFINDLFPKDYVSFYIGRDDEYLKKPSDALRLSLYPDFVNIDCAIIPHFIPNTLPQGDRLSFFDSFQGGISGRDSQRYFIKPAYKASNTQYALRLYRTIGSNEATFYFFRGFDPSARSYFNEMNRELFYERLDAYGASIRGPIAGGIANFEVGYYNSVQDKRGDNRLIENSAFKALAGFEKDLGNDFKVSVQYLYEQKLDYDAYAAALLAGDYFWDKHRHLLTQRLSKLYKNQTVTLGLFNFWSPSDKDGYVRASCTYEITDQWKVTIGLNIPWGDDNLTDFSMMQKNKNAFVRLRYSF